MISDIPSIIKTIPIIIAMYIGWETENAPSKMAMIPIIRTNRQVKPDTPFILDIIPVIPNTIIIIPTR